MSTPYSVSAAATATADRIDRDEVLVMTVHRGTVYTRTSMRQWEPSGCDTVSDVVRDCVRRGDGFARYYVVEPDGSYSEAR